VVGESQSTFIADPMIPPIDARSVHRGEKPQTADKPAAHVRLWNGVPPGSHPATDALDSVVGRRQFDEVKRDHVTMISPRA
jgi:hypothetical protein